MMMTTKTTITEKLTKEKNCFTKTYKDKTKISNNIYLQLKFNFKLS